MNNPRMITLAICVLVVVLAVARLSGWGTPPSLEERVQSAWANDASKESETENPQLSEEAVAELRAVIGARSDEPPETAAEETQAASDPVAQYQYALRLANQASPDYDMAEAEKWFTLAAQQGHIGAARRLGDYYRDGPKKDLNRALHWYSYPRTHYMTTGQLVGGGETEMALLREAEIAVLVEKREAASSEPKKPMTAYETGEVIGAILKSTMGNAEAPQPTDEATNQHDPKTTACRKEALKHITTCSKVTDTINCETWGCPEVVRCDGYARACEGHGAPYNSNDEFYCDKRNWRTRDFVLENVLQRACPAA